MQVQARWLGLAAAIGAAVLLFGCWDLGEEGDEGCWEGDSYCWSDEGYWGGDGDSDPDAVPLPDGGVDPGDGPRCVPGRSVGCACVDGASGAQVCLPDGTYGPCECVPSGGADGDSDVDVDVDADGDGDPDGGGDGGTGDPDGGCYWYCP